MKIKDKRPGERVRSNRRSHKTPVTKPRFTPQKISFVAVGAALSFGLGYQAIAASEPVATTSTSNPFTSMSATNSTPVSVPSAAASTSPSASGQQGPTTAGINPTGSTNLGSGNAANNPSAIPFDPSESVLSGAQTCSEDMKVIREEALLRDIEMADSGFDVDVFFKKARDSGCLVSIQDSISLANQITSLSGGSIASMIMSQVESKIMEAGNQMLQKVFDKGCEVMLEASQQVYGPINDVVKKYGDFANPDFVGDTVGGLIDGVVDEAMFDFDNKLDDIADKITQKNQSNNSGGGSSGNSGPLLPTPDEGMGGNSTGNQNLGEAEKAAAQKTVEDLAASRNNITYPYYEKRREVWRRDPRTGNRYLQTYFIDVSLHTLNDRNPKGITINSIERGGAPQNSANAVCVYVAQITSINNEIRRLVNEKGVENTANLPVKPLNVSPGYWSQANNYIRNISNGSADCADPAIAVDPNANNNSGDDVVAPIFGDYQSSINYGSSARAVPSSPSAVAPANTTQPATTTSPTTNEATQYMENRQGTSSSGNNTEAPATTEKPERSSNPFSRMRSMFN